ncbi:hypothetical protein BLNAU_5553 [Blattamonas nauphoetae]|uniref:Uncharacterized protein n=1 Tax=Blattamonas nauphoetae TaxID=2049346 RepID=A0ABQ9Y749_9EUKA|nr:hypothetical protein BLNAU_5553 [Blattamonas nauphoetae]
MEENEKRREMERNKEKEEIEAERRKERERIEDERKKEREELKRKEEDIARKEEERRKEFERQMAELKRERETNQQFIKEGLERQKEKEEEEERKRTRVGTEAIELFPPSNYTLSGSAFTKRTQGDGGCLVSFEFCAVVARLSLIVGNVPQNRYVIGIISSALAANAQTTNFYQLTGGAGGWDLWTLHLLTWLNATYTNNQKACAAGAAGQRVVIEADGREGRRIVRLSQDGQTQPTFFTNIPVPFRFAVFMWTQNDSVTIESVEVAKEAQMVGGTIPVQM